MEDKTESSSYLILCMSTKSNLLNKYNHAQLAVHLEMFFFLYSIQREFFAVVILMQIETNYRTYHKFFKIQFKILSISSF